MKRTIRVLFLGGSLALASWAANAEAPAGSDSASVGKSDLIYGGELMTPDEIADYNRRLSGDVTPADREKFMMEHRERMEKRATERNVKLKESASKAPANEPSKSGGGGGGNLPGGGVGSGGTSGGMGGVGGAGSGGGVGP